MPSERFQGNVAYDSCGDEGEMESWFIHEVLAEERIPRTLGKRFYRVIDRIEAVGETIISLPSALIEFWGR